MGQSQLWHVQTYTQTYICISIYTLCVQVFCLHACLSATCMQCQGRPEEGVGSSGTAVTDGCKMPCGCWQWKPGLLQEQPVFSALRHLCSPSDASEV